MTKLHEDIESVFDFSDRKGWLWALVAIVGFFLLCFAIGGCVDSPKTEYCNADYCITEGQTLKQIGGM